MKHKLLYTFTFLLAAALFLGSCKKGSLEKKSSTGSLTVDSNAVVSTIYGGHYSSVAADKSGNIFASSGRYGSDTVFKFNQGKSAIYVSPVTLSHDTATTHTIGSLTTDSLGNVYAVDYNNTTGTNVVKITPAGAASIVFTNISPAGINQVVKTAIDGSGNFYYLDQEQQIHKITAGGATSIAVTKASGFAIDKYDDIIYDDTQSGLQKLTPAGVKTTIATLPGITGTSASQLAADNFGNIYAGLAANNKISIIKINSANVANVVISTPSGYQGGPVKDAQIGYPFSLIADFAGNLYFCNQAPDYLTKITF